MDAAGVAQGQEAFRTHYNYIRSLRNLVKGATLSHTNISQIPPARTPHLGTKRNLIRLTAKSLSDESKIVRRDEEYSYASTSWLPVKTYYLLFNQMLTIDYLLTLDPKMFTVGAPSLLRINSKPGRFRLVARSWIPYTIGRSSTITERPDRIFATPRTLTSILRSR